jgi:hypothetical protein
MVGMGIVPFCVWFGLLFGVVGGVVAVACSATMRTGVWMTLGLFILAAPWHIALEMDDPQAYYVVPIWFAGLGESRSSRATSPRRGSGGGSWAFRANRETDQRGQDMRERSVIAGKARYRDRTCTMR